MNICSVSLIFLRNMMKLQEDKRVNKVGRMQTCAIEFKWQSLEGEQETMKNYTVNSILNKFGNLGAVFSQEWNYRLDMGSGGSYTSECKYICL